MEKMNCDIIRDLIPSYMDEVCSEATKQCVEEHICSCDSCRQMVTCYKEHILSGNQLEQKSLDGLKIIKDVMKFQNLVCYAILSFLVFLGIWTFIANRYFSMLFSQSFLFVICILANLLSCISCRGKKPLGKKEHLFGAISFILDLYFVLIFFYMSNQIRQEAATLFGRELNKVGPFLERQLIAAFSVQLAFFVYNLFCIIRQDKNCNWLLCLNMMGIFLALRYDLWMKYMDSAETLFQTITRETSEVVIIGIAGIAASLLITKGIQKRMH